MSGLKEHTEQFTDAEIRQELVSPETTMALIHELTTRNSFFELCGTVLSYEFGNRLIDEIRQWRAAEQIEHVSDDMNRAPFWLGIRRRMSNGLTQHELTTLEAMAKLAQTEQVPQ